MIDLPTKMLKELEEEGSTLPQAVIFHNLAEIALNTGKLEVKEKDGEVHVKGMFTIKGEAIKV